jgi:hypothetical protein
MDGIIFTKRVEFTTRKYRNELAPVPTEIYRFYLRVDMKEKRIEFLKPKSLREMIFYAHELKRAFGKPGEL